MEEEVKMTPVAKQRFAAFAATEPTSELVRAILQYREELRQIEQGKGMPLSYQQMFKDALEVYQHVFTVRRQEELAQ